MEGKLMPSGEPPKVRTRKSKTRDPTVDINQGSQVHGQQPPVRRSNRAAQHQQSPDIAYWHGYRNADPAQTYPEHYGYRDEQCVDTHGYGYGGAQADAHQDYGYGNASQGYGYGDSCQGYGNEDASQGHGYNDAGQGYAYGGAQVGAAQGYGYGGAQGDGGDYVATSQHTVKQKPKKNRKPKPVVDGVYEGEYQGSYESQHQGDGFGQSVWGSNEGSYGSQHQVDPYGQPGQNGYAYPETYNVVSEQKAHNRESTNNRKPSKVRSPKKGDHGDAAYVDPGNGAYAAQHGEPSYGVTYDNGMIPAVGANSKGRETNTQNQYEDLSVRTGATPYATSALPSRAISRIQGEHDGEPGSARSRTSQEGGGLASGRSKSSDREGSGSSRAEPHRDGSRSGSGRVKDKNETRSSREGLTPTGTPRVNPVGKDASSSRSREKMESEGKPVKTSEVIPLVRATPNPNPLNEYLRETATSGKPAYNDISMAVFHDPNDRTPVDVKISKDQANECPEAVPAARPSLNEWVKKQSEFSGGNNFNQHESLIVMPDDNKELLETQMFGAPLAKKHAIKLPPVVETVGRPQYQPRGENNQYQPVVEKPLYQPVQRRPYVNTPLLPSNEPQVGAQVYDAEGKQIQPVVPNAKCMACVHGIGVPLARFTTRIVCQKCLSCSCTIM